jgi:hypothetical protein
VHVIGRLVGRAGIQRSPQPVRGARQRHRATDQRLTQRTAQLGYASLHADLADRVARQAWPGRRGRSPRSPASWASTGTPA